MRILKENTIGLVIDIQERLFPHIHNNEQLKSNVTILIEGLKALEIPMIVSEQYKKGLGDTIQPLNGLLKGCAFTEKMAFSCCDEPTIIEKVELSGKRFVLLAGIEAHICLLQTAIDLKERGYTPVVVEDCIGSRNSENKRIALERYKQEGVVITSYESILFELCRYAGGDVFKAISKLVK